MVNLCQTSNNEIKLFYGVPKKVAAFLKVKKMKVGLKGGENRYPLSQLTIIKKAVIFSGKG